MPGTNYWGVETSYNCFVNNPLPADFFFFEFNGLFTFKSDTALSAGPPDRTLAT